MKAAMLRPVVAVLLSIWFSTFGRAQVFEEENTDRISSSMGPIKQVNSPDLAEVAKLIVQKTNAFRRNEGLETAATDSKLTETAQYFAEYMAQTDRYGHTADGKRPSERAKEHGYEYCLVSENIAYQFSSAGFGAEELAEKFFEGWKESPPHRKNMLNNAITETGLAVAQSEQTGHFYSVQMFGRPKSKQIEFQVANQTDVEVEYRLGDRTFTLNPRFTRTHLRCQSTELAFRRGESAEQQAQTVQPADGDKFVVTGDTEKLTVQKE
jgi:uncharacterized protein YkwD